jgi:hypothetical protein
MRWFAFMSEGGMGLILEQLPLPRQLEMVFKRLFGELDYLSSGTVFVQIRNNAVGKFGIRHNPIESRDGTLKELDLGKGLTKSQQLAFSKMAIQSLSLKRNWTHGEIYFDFSVRQNLLMTSVQFETNYNMANLVSELTQSRT